LFENVALFVVFCVKHKYPSYLIDNIEIL